MEGVKFCAKYSFVTNKLKYCGPPRAVKVFNKLLLEGSRVEEAKELLKRFEALHPYLEIIAQKSGRDPFDKDVVEAYWIGNELLEKIEEKDYRELIKRFGRRGLPMRMALQLVEKLPERAIPHHAFHVLFVGVGMITGSVPTTLQNMDRCRISWGRVKETHNDRVIAMRSPLIFHDGQFSLGHEERATFLQNWFVPPIEKGDFVSLHWGYCIDKLNKDQVRNLERYTRWSIEAANEANIKQRD